jgi:IS30 family transposase
VGRSLNAHLGNISAVARELGYNRGTVRIWARRCKSFSKNRFKYTGIKHKSTKPKNIHYALTLQQEARVITLRDTRHLDQSKIAKLIFKQYGVKVSPKTIYNVIKRRQPELIVPKCE